jgi:hypothetical protein
MVLWGATSTSNSNRLSRATRLFDLIGRTVLTRTVNKCSELIIARHSYNRKSTT